MTDAPHIFVLAGESSGDRLGAALMRRLREETGGGVRFSGVGGEAMIAEGLDSIFPMRDLSVMGFVEVLPHLRRLMRRLREASEAVVQARPDALITIDAQVFSARLAKRVRIASPSTALIHTVAPTVWAWKPGRARKVARYLDRLLALFPFEPPLFECHGLPTDFIGHPVVERVGALPKDAGQAFRAELGIAPDARVLLVAPGSRVNEIERLQEPFGDAAARLAARGRGKLEIVVPIAASVADQLLDAVAGWDCNVHVLDPRGLSFEAAEQRKFAAFAASDVALAASGTVTLELAAMRVPVVVGYRMPKLTEFAIRRLVKVRTGTLVNIITGDPVVPEFWQDDCNGEKLSTALGTLLDDESARARQINGFDRALALLGENETLPSTRAALAILDAIEKKRQRLSTFT